MPLLEWIGAVAGTTGTGSVSMAGRIVNETSGGQLDVAGKPNCLGSEGIPVTLVLEGGWRVGSIGFPNLPANYGQASKYGYDIVGPTAGAVTAIRAYARQGSLSLPCAVRYVQTMNISCKNATNQYESNEIGFDIDTNSVTSVRGPRGEASSVTVAWP